MSEPLQKKETDALEQAAADVSILLSELGNNTLKCSHGVQTRAAYNDAWNHVMSVAKDTASQVLASAGPREVAAARTPPKPIEAQPSAISLAAKAMFVGVPNKSELARLAIEELAEEYLERLEPLRSTLRNAVRDLSNGDSGSLTANLQRAAVAASESGHKVIISQGQRDEEYSELLEAGRGEDAYVWMSLHNLLDIELWRTNRSDQVDRLTTISDQPQAASKLKHVVDRLLNRSRRNLLPEFSARWQQPPDGLAVMWTRLIDERVGLNDNARLAISDWYAYECSSYGFAEKMPHLPPLDPMPEPIDAQPQPCFTTKSVGEVTRRGGGRRPLSQSTDPKGIAKLQIYELIRSALASNPDWGGNHLLDHFRTDSHFKSLLATAGLKHKLRLFRNALAWLKSNPHAG